MIDRELAVLLAEHEQAAAAEPSVEDLVAAAPAFDEDDLPDPFADLPRGVG